MNVNIAATTVENYRLLKEAGIGTYILFQETYSKEHYEALHPTGPKSNYAYHTEAMDRAMEGGIDDVGIGVLFGLNTYRYDFVGLLMHAEHLEATFGVGPHTISVPRICPADDISTEDFPDAISDEMFCRIVAVARIAVPYTGMIISTRESESVRRRVLELGVSQISGGSRTSVGGYAVPEAKRGRFLQFDVSDRRTLDEVVSWLLDLGHIPALHRLLSRGTYRRPLHVARQARTDSKLLPAQCTDDIKRISGGLCLLRNQGEGHTADS